MCPFEATTSNEAPRYFLIVFALAGDSTTTSVFRIRWLFFPIIQGSSSVTVISAAKEARRALYYYVLQGKRQESGRGGLRRETGLGRHRVGMGRGGRQCRENGDGRCRRRSVEGGGGLGRLRKGRP